MEEQLLVSIRGAARMLGFKTVKPIERLISEGKIMTVTVNGNRKVVRDSIIKFINKES